MSFAMSPPVGSITVTPAHPRRPGNIPAQRQVHLDFHTSPHIRDVAADFDPDAFAQAFADAHVDSVTVFAKCHHGMSYYPTRSGRRHPHLTRHDLLGEQIEALHRRGIRAPIYTTVGWEEDVADRFPQWRQMHADGTFARLANSADGVTRQPGGWRFNDLISPDYQDYIEAHIRELLAAYPVDGIFFDICFYSPGAHHSSAAVRFRERMGLTGTDEGTFVRFESTAQAAFAARFTPMVCGAHPSASVFYNTANNIQIDSRVGPVQRWEHQTHWEIESLPSGFWGYHHFPRLARFANAKRVPWLGMTGRFQKMWGDFGGIKPQPALEYECFRSQAMGGANSVGDQLHPRGRHDRAAIGLIGRVYEQCRSAESFYTDSRSLPTVGVFVPAHPTVASHDADRSLEGAVLLLEQLHYDALVLDDSCDLAGLSLVILPDTVVLTESLSQKLRAFLAGGRRVLASYRSTLLPTSTLAYPAGLRVKGPSASVPSYWRVRDTFCPELSESDRVVYQQGLDVVPPQHATDVAVLIDRVPSYFNRTDLTFCSHFQAPPTPDPDPMHPAAFAGTGWVYFADPVFREYRQTGNTAVFAAVRSALERLIGPPPFGKALPQTMGVYPRRRADALLLTLLHYVPVRTALDIDVVGERLSFAGELLHLPAQANVVFEHFSRRPLERHPETGAFILPPAKGRLLLESPGFFADPIRPTRTVV